ncbi:hypothetical protein Nocox_13125 [Nonomuraea coxensis DSM 45129]|uniref:DUF305 domain-containing protein n=1 Tax=Nonomuraea coxensis DSM 45129 TaxID=1122611 RepID=A0ABX8U0P2_9ACTN|nr:DUF305 domain-containing protein [Nonomuraea coxensis]QYC40242.1 hypothetical protein Nocox_13125 [Nonomuraea coxensis DSM 45129]
MKRRCTKAAMAAGALLAVIAAGSGTPYPSPSPTGPSPVCPGARQFRPVAGEYDYLAQMVPHHEDAIAAARQLDRSQRPELRRLGQSIVRTQTAEVGTMKGWLERWYPRSPAPSPRGSTMPDLSGLSGDRLDETFLQYMIPHHMMAIMMSQQLLMHGEARHAEVADFARQVRDEQRAEVRLMWRYMGQWFGDRDLPCAPRWPGMMPGS